VPHVPAGNANYFTNEQGAAGTRVLCLHSKNFVALLIAKPKYYVKSTKSKRAVEGTIVSQFGALVSLRIVSKPVTPYKGPGRPDLHYKAISAHVTWIILQKRIEELVCIFNEYTY
jgi:hypothetical protein